MIRLVLGAGSDANADIVIGTLSTEGVHVTGVLRCLNLSLRESRGGFGAFCENLVHPPETYSAVLAKQLGWHSQERASAWAMTDRIRADDDRTGKIVMRWVLIGSAEKLPTFCDLEPDGMSAFRPDRFVFVLSISFPPVEKSATFLSAFI